MQKRNNPLYIKKSGIKISVEIKEYFVLYCTEFNNTFYAECVDKLEDEAERFEILFLKKKQAELKLNYNATDSKSRIEERFRRVKVRKLNKAMGENFELLYDYKCQICGMNF